jgi:hypothetical protein
MNVISFSLWGNAPLYRAGELRNIALAKHFYPNWIMPVLRG